jgi:hypothetical protein
MPKPFRVDPGAAPVPAAPAIIINPSPAAGRVNYEDFR